MFDMGKIHIQHRKNYCQPSNMGQPGLAQGQVPTGMAKAKLPNLSLGQFQQSVEWPELNLPVLTQGWLIIEIAKNKCPVMAQTWVNIGKPKLDFPTLGQTWPLCPTLGTCSSAIRNFPLLTYIFHIYRKDFDVIIIFTLLDGLF